MKMNKVLVLSASVLVSGFLLQGCENIVHSETKLSQNKMKLQQEEIFEDIIVDKMDAGYIAALSRHYSSQGDGGDVDLTVIYDPQSSTNTAMHASSHAARISEDFRKNGVHVNSSILPVKGQGNVARAVVSYDSFALAAPDDCEMMPGMHDRNIDTPVGYQLGCTRDSIFAKQIARPKDLMGGGETQDTSDGRRAANIVDGYRTGVQNEPLDGESSSE